MINNWQKSTGESYKSSHTYNEETIRAVGEWSQKARSSSGLTKNNDAVDIVPAIEDFPNILRETIVKSEKIYQKCRQIPEYELNNI